ncbi:thioredoxin family protein [Reichenbachiella sp.]|uniref:thioredoxin family protein n=1 Tax=Reichenbachiella sp. TaxID=2184521 RepID=UPI003BB101DA
MSKSVFYHAGCPVCVSVEQEILGLIDANAVEVVHLGEDKGKVSTAEEAGVQSVPALVTPSGNVLHINFGASLDDLKA